jgi:TRAP-type transport system periplasmic protein
VDRNQIETAKDLEREPVDVIVEPMNTNRPSRSGGNAATTLLKSSALAALTALSSISVNSATHASAEPVTLRLADVNRIPTQTVRSFADRVAELSAGELTIEIVGDCCTSDADTLEQLVERVAAGDFDLGSVGTRVFAEVGVTTFEAFMAPFLIDSYAVQQAVLASDIPAEMLTALDEIGLDGLGVLPGQLRKPLAVHEPLIGPRDWHGVTVHVIGSTTGSETIEALGATPSSVGFTERDNGLTDGTIDAIENTLAFQGLGRQSTIPYATLNVNLWPSTSALIANPDALAGLTDSQIEWLHQASDDIIATTGELAALDAELINRNCALGARYAEASDADLVALTDAVASVYTRLEQDATTETFIEQIRDLKTTAPAEDPLAIPDGCRAGAPSTDETAPVNTAALNGTFQTIDWTADRLIDAGVTEEEAQMVAGAFTFTFDNGSFALSHNDAVVCVGDYTISTDVVTVDYSGPSDCGPGGVLFTATFDLSNDTLTFSDMTAGFTTDAILFGTEPLTRVD